MGNREDLVALESRLEQSRFEQSRFEQSRLEQSRFEQSIGKMSESEAQDAFIIFDEAYEGKDVDAFYLADILRAVGCNVTNASATSHGKTEALGCNVTNASATSHGKTEALGEKRITFAEFGPILAAVKADMSATGCKEDYIEGLKVFDKESTGKVPLAEVANCLASLGEKLDAEECDRLMAILGVTEDEDGFVMYEEFIANLLSKCP